MDIDTLRQDYLNPLLSRAEGETIPWTDDQCDSALVQALQRTWPDLGVFTSGTVDTDEDSPVYELPDGVEKVSRITLEQTSGGRLSIIDTISNWMVHSDTEVIIRPAIATSSELALRFYGWGRFDDDATNLPAGAESIIASKAASIAWGIALAGLGNFQNQLGLDSGRVVTHQDAVALSAYWQRQYEDAIRHSPYRVSFAPRAAVR